MAEAETDSHDKDQQRRLSHRWVEGRAVPARLLSEDRRNPLKSERLPKQSGALLLRDFSEAFIGSGQQAAGIRAPRRQTDISSAHTATAGSGQRHPGQGMERNAALRTANEARMDYFRAMPEAGRAGATRPHVSSPVSQPPHDLRGLGVGAQCIRRGRDG